MCDRGRDIFDVGRPSIRLYHVRQCLVGVALFSMTGSSWRSSAAAVDTAVTAQPRNAADFIRGPQRAYRGQCAEQVDQRNNIQL